MTGPQLETAVGLRLLNLGSRQPLVGAHVSTVWRCSLCHEQTISDRLRFSFFLVVFFSFEILSLLHSPPHLFLYHHRSFSLSDLVVSPFLQHDSGLFRGRGDAGEHGRGHDHGYERATGSGKAWPGLAGQAAPQAASRNKKTYPVAYYGHQSALRVNSLLACPG